MTNSSCSFLSPAQTAQLLGIAEKTLANWRSLCRGPRYTRVGRSIRYTLKDIEKYTENRAVEPELAPIRMGA